MKKLIVVLFTVIVSATAIAPALARLQTSDVVQAYGSSGQAFIAPPGHPNMMIEVLDIKWSPFGSHDTLILYVWFDKIDETPVNDFLPVKGVIDNAESASLLDAMFAGIPTWLGTEVVKDNELEVWREGRSLFATLAVEVSLAPTPFYIPPLKMEFEGCGRAIHSMETMPLPSGYTITMTYMGFNALVTFVCHPWKCVWPAGGFVAVHAHLTITGS